MLLRQIEVYLRKARISPTRFGRDALGDPNFVLDLQDGRVCRRTTEQRVLAYLARAEAALSCDPAR